MQEYAVWLILLKSYFTCFECPPHPSSGVLKTVTGTGHNIGATIFILVINQLDAQNFVLQ